MPLMHLSPVLRLFARALQLPLALALTMLGWSSVLAADSGGERAYSSGVTVSTLWKTRTDSAGKPLAYPAGAPAEITAVLVEIAPGRQTNWHRHPVPCLAYVLEGEVRVELAGGEVKILKAGEAAAEVVDLLHNGTNPGPKPARLVMFALGTVGQPYAIKAPVDSTK